MAYSPDYDTSDMTSSIFDGLVIFILTIASFSALIVIILIWKMAKKQLPR